MATLKPNNKETLKKYYSKFQKLHANIRNGRPSPHKPAMLLAVLSLADNGQLPENKIEYSQELLALFKSIFIIIQTPADRCSPLLPFFHMRSEEFWHLKAMPGKEDIVAEMTTPAGAGKLMELIEYASLDQDLFNLISQPMNRVVLRLAIIEKYFSEYRDALLALCGEEIEIGKVREDWQEQDFIITPSIMEKSREIRKAAFAREVRQAYDYRCAACGTRFRYYDITVIDAAHLIPFHETHDDSPTNGMALCKNHHWLMDRHLIAPGPGARNNYEKPRWYVCKDLTDRIEGQRDLLKLKNQTVLLPNDTRLCPKRESLDRQMAMFEEAQL